MTYNYNNEKYTSALGGLPVGWKTRKVAVEFRPGRGRKMESHKLRIYPILRNPPDTERLGRAILELALLSGNQKSERD